MIVVFDFDKTLTNKDTLWKYFIFCANKKRLSFPFKLLLFGFVLVFVKFKIINNLEFKNIGISLFLKDINLNELTELSFKYSKKIVKSSIYFNDYLQIIENKANNVYVISASFLEYLQFIFPIDRIIASSMFIKNNKPSKVKYNCYGNNKTKALKAIGIEKIDILYTDSKSDIPLVIIANEIFLVKKNIKLLCKSEMEFLEKLK
jgi:phosphoserine phosphatase